MTRSRHPSLPTPASAKPGDRRQNRPKPPPRKRGSYNQGVTNWFGSWPLYGYARFPADRPKYYLFQWYIYRRPLCNTAIATAKSRDLARQLAAAANRQPQGALP